ncbi:MAG: DUF7133 domain-containing protein, partial [Planctomycetota bacterium]
LLLHEGVFTKSNIETPWGTIRTRDAAVWRFDPRTQRLQVLSHCSFANPWGHVFDDYGQSVLADASGGENFAFSQVIMPFDYPHKPRRSARLLHRGRPTAGCELIASRHFPDDVQETFTVNQSIGFHGTRWDRILPDGSAWRAVSMPQDLVSCSDTNFRPVAMEIGPDGAMYIADWCNPLIGHMQYNVRDPRRDHTHGRIWRVRHADRALLDPPQVATAAVPDLLALLRLPERNTRQHARRRLQRAAASELFPELARWMGRLEATDPLHDRLVLEALWLHQAHGRIDLGLLRRVVTLDEPRARAGALRVLRYWLQQGAVAREVALPMLEGGVRDDDMRVRLEAVVACGFVPSVAGASVAALAAELPMDDGLRIAVEETLAYLSKYGEPTSAIARRLRVERAPTDKLLEMELDDIVASVTLTRPDAPRERRDVALTHLAGDDASSRVQRLLQELTEARYPPRAREALAPMLLTMTKEDLGAAMPQLSRHAAEGRGEVRALAVAGVLLAEGDAAEWADDDPELMTDALSLLEPATAPTRVVSELRRSVTAGEVGPADAVTQIARHTGDRAALFEWLAGLVEPVEDEGLTELGDAHARAMAALRAMNGIKASEWPDGFESYRITPATPELLERGRRVYHDTIRGCARCHGPDGRGEEGFPPLDRSPYLLGAPARAAGIVVHGLVGRIQFPDGRSFESAMEPLGGMLNDEQIAAVLTYLRQSWGNFAPPVSTEYVARARALVPRTGMWNVNELSRTYPLYHDRLLPQAALAAATRPEPGMRLGTFLAALGMQAVPVVLLLVLITLALRLGRR